jgi:hypothetical protein
MKRNTARAASLPAVVLSLAIVSLGAARAAGPDPVSGLVWRNIGPFRAGRVSAVSGAVGEAGVFYAGFPTGGLWKTSNAGTTWVPIFDAVTTTSSIGAVQVAPSDSSVVYVGTGDMPTGGNINEGDGVYKSTDAGKTWQHIGLEDSRQIPSILVDPHDPNLVILAAQGNRYAKGGQRGVYRSTDGGKTWSKTLDTGDSIGVERLAWANDAPSTVLAATDLHYVNVAAFGGGFRGGNDGPTGTALYKSSDQGLTWHELTGGGLPRLAGRMSVAVAMHTNGQRMYLIGNFGLYRSDDGGANWRQMDAADRRVGNGQGGYNCGVYVSSSNPDVVITINTSSYISTDGGNTFTGFKGAPGGDDPQQLWIDPTDGQRMLLGMDQGATVTLDGGRTWSQWYNQSTEQVYHISVDNSFPYYVYASQQDAGAIRTRSRGNYGAITPVDWNPVGGWEWGTDIIDPLNNNILYASGSGIQKIFYPTEQIVNVSPASDPDLHLRTTSSNPLVFAPWDKHELLAGFQYLMATSDGGTHWRKLSPDLGYPKGVTPPPDTAAPAPGRPRGGIIDCIAASSVTRGLIWVGTNNGLIKMTRDHGLTWTDVSIPNLPDSNRTDVQTIEASHFNPAEAYAALDAHNAGDYQPQLYRTRDYGKTWTKVVAGLPTGQIGGSFTRLIREDTKKAGLLFAGTESGMYVSFDDADHWQSLQLNLPTTSFRDAVIKDNDLVVGTYGRGIWILDDISPLRQMTPTLASEAVCLFKPGDALRIRRNTNQNTPFPPEVPHADNPPDGAIVYYYLATQPSGTVTLDVLDSSGAVVRHMSSAPITPVTEAATPPEPSFWLETPRPLPAAVGTNRVNWDLRYDDPPAFSHSWEINANPGLTPVSPQGPLALPGVYTIKLTVGGKSYSQTVTVRDDPRSPATAVALREEHALQMKMVQGMAEAWDGYHQAAAVRTTLAADTGAGVPADVAQAARALSARIDTVAGNPTGGRGFFRFGGQAAPPTFVAVNGALVRQINNIEMGDGAPTPATQAEYAATCSDLKKAVTAWQGITTKDLVAFNALLSKNNLTPLAGDPPALAVPVCGGAKGGAAVAKARAGNEVPTDEDRDPDEPPE